MIRSDSWKQGLRLVAAGVLGYGLIAALTSAGFNLWLGGADLFGGGPLLQLQGTLVAVVAGLAGGMLAGWIGGRRPILHALAVLPLLIIDTIYVLFFFDGTAPLWFDLVGGLVLMASTVAGAAMLDTRRREIH